MQQTLTNVETKPLAKLARSFRLPVLYLAGGGSRHFCLLLLFIIGNMSRRISLALYSRVRL